MDARNVREFAVVSIRLERDTWVAARDLARQERRPLSALLRMFVEDGLAARGVQPMR